MIRKIAHKIIAFLEQLENFQKKLWLKKKFVIETHYCFTLDRVPEKLYPEIAGNAAQREEWVKLFAIDEIKAEKLGDVAYSVPLTVEFLKSQEHLVLDTRHFSAEFKQKLLASMNDLDEKLDGLLVHSENFQALQLLTQRYREKIDCVYIDPPYNTSENTFKYKNSYKHSSWAAMMLSRLEVATGLIARTGVLEVAIDDTEGHRLRTVLDQLLGEENRVATVAAEVNPAGQNLRANTPALSHDYCHIYARCIDDTTMLLRELTDEEIGQYEQHDGGSHYLWDNLRRRGGNSRPTDRPGQWFPLFVSANSVRVPELAWEPATKQWLTSDDPKPDEAIIWPVDPKGLKRIWRVNPDGARRAISSGDISVIHKAGRLEVVKKSYMPEGRKPKTLWDDPKYSATTHGTKLLIDLLGNQSFSYPKSLYLVMDCLRFWADSNTIILDFFAGSGTTAHAVINLNREDGGSRKYILVEMGEYFHTVLLPRIKKVVYAKDWKDGKPVARDTGISHGIKYLRLESYEDALANLELHRSKQQAGLLNANDDLREQYMLSYMLDAESRNSAVAGSLLNMDAFANPDQYRLKVERNGETQSVAIDLIETFNYLLGLTIKHMDTIHGVRVVDGKNPQGQRVLVLWRTIAEMDNDKLDRWFEKQKYNTREKEYDIYYVNGDNNLENLRREDQTWKVRLIEEEFQRLMFEVGE